MNQSQPNSKDSSSSCFLDKVDSKVIDAAIADAENSINPFANSVHLKKKLVSCCFSFICFKFYFYFTLIFKNIYVSYLLVEDDCETRLSLEEPLC